MGGGGLCTVSTGGTQGLCHTRKDKYDEGMRRIDLAMELDPDDSHIWLATAFEEDRKADAG